MVLGDSINLGPSEQDALMEGFERLNEALIGAHQFFGRSFENADDVHEERFKPWNNNMVALTSNRWLRGKGIRMNRVFIVTANERETRAVHDYFNSILPSGEGATFNADELILPRYEFVMETDSGKVKVNVTQADETGGSEATDVLRRIVDRVDPDAVFFVGCAALLDEKQKTKPNSVFIARRAIDSDKMELAKGDALYDMEQHQGDRNLRRAIIELSGANEFVPINLVTNRDFISGSAFFRDREIQRRKDLVKKYPEDAVVLEMEAFEIYKEVHKMRSEGSALRVVVIKGISDLGDEDAQTDKETSQRIATENAATVVGKLLIRTAG